MKKVMVALAVVLLLGLASGGAVGAMVGYEDEDAEVGITAIGIDLEEGSDVVATGEEGNDEGDDGDERKDEEGDGDGDDEDEKKNSVLPYAVGAGVVLLGGGTLVLRKKK